MPAMPLGSLWLPVLVSAAAVWILSALAWTALPHHKSDFGRLPDEDDVRGVLRKSGVRPGTFVVPYWGAMTKENRPALEAKMVEGPVAIVTVGRTGVPRMGPNMVASFVYYVVVSFVVAYIARHTLQPGLPFHPVLRITGATAIAAYTLALVPESIWFWRPWRWTIKSIVDGIVYGVVTGLIFAALWPAA